MSPRIRNGLSNLDIRLEGFAVPAGGMHEVAAR
jgi:hypothetical protein